MTRTGTLVASAITPTDKTLIQIVAHGSRDYEVRVSYVHPYYLTWCRERSIREARASANKLWLQCEGRETMIVGN